MSSYPTIHGRAGISKFRLLRFLQPAGVADPDLELIEHDHHKVPFEPNIAPFILPQTVSFGSHLPNVLFNMAVPDRGPQIDAVQISMIVGTTIAVTLRFLGRFVAKAGFWWDDWTILMALPLSLGCNVANLVGECIAGAQIDGDCETDNESVAVRNGLGKHTSATPDAAERYRHNLYSDELMYNTCLAIIKWSVLLMYYRIFGVNRGFTRALKIFGAIIAIWWIGTEFAIIFQCTPIHKAWRVEVPGHCIDIEAFFLGQAIPNIAQDIVILLLPQHQLWKLEMSLQKKVALTGIFMCGAFTAASSLVRLNVIIHLTEEDITWNYYEASIWSALEPGVGIISACLPCLGPLFRLCFVRDKKDSGTVASSDYWPSRQRSDAEHSYYKVFDNESSTMRLRPEGIEYRAAAYRNDSIPREASVSEASYPMDAIHVRSKVEWRSDESLSHKHT